MSHGTYALNQIACVRKDKYKPRAGEELACIELEHIEKGSGRILGNAAVNMNSCTKNMFFKGDVLFGKLRPNLRKFAYPCYDGLCSSEIWVLKPNTDLVLGKFLFYLVQSQRFIREACKTVGTKMPRADWFVLEDFKFNIPPKDRQEESVYILQTWDTAIEKTEALIAVKREQFKWLHSITIRQSEHTKPTKFGDFLSESRISDTENNPKKRLSVRLHLKGVEVRKFRGTESEDAVQYYRREAGQLIYGKQNFSRGAIGIVPDELDGYSSSQDIPAFDVANMVNPKWLFWYLSRPNFYKKLGLLAAGSGSKRLHASEIYKVLCHLPPLSEQKHITAILDAHWHEITLLERLSDCYRNQKRGLMRRLLTGTWRLRK